MIAMELFGALLFLRKLNAKIIIEARTRPLIYSKITDPQGLQCRVQKILTWDVVLFRHQPRVHINIPIASRCSAIYTGLLLLNSLLLWLVLLIMSSICLPFQQDHDMPSNQFFSFFFRFFFRFINKNAINLEL